jgi:hypothetical protein
MQDTAMIKPIILKIMILMICTMVITVSVANNMPEYILGSWQINKTNQYEHWSKVDDKNYQGQVIQINGGRKVVKENLKIALKGDQLLYQAQVLNQNDGGTIEYVGKATNITEFKVANFNHDFPQLIEYQQHSSDKITTKVMDKMGEGFTQELTRKDLPTTIPEWFFADMEAHIGRWETDNSKYQSANEPFDTYVIEWQWGIGKTSLTGRLFGVENGNNSPDFWHFRQYWDNLAQKAMVQQFGNGGVMGLGELRLTNDTQSELIQTFTTPSGAQWQGKHLNELNGNQFTTQSFQMGQDGGWQADRIYIWHKR